MSWRVAYQENFRPEWPLDFRRWHFPDLKVHLHGLYLIFHTVEIKYTSIRKVNLLFVTSIIRVGELLL